MATTDDGPKKQHILPKVYLKHFLNEDGQIFYCKIKDELKSKKIKSTGLGGIAYKNQFYNLTEGILDDITNDKDELFVETKVNQYYENKIVKYWPFFQTRIKSLTIDDKHQIASIILHLKLRNEFIRNLVFNQSNLPELVESSILELREISQHDRSALKNIDEYYELLYDVLLSHFQELGPAGMHNTFLVNSLYGEVTDARKAVLWRLVQGSWTVLEVDAPLSFIVSDNIGLPRSYDNKINFEGKFDFFLPLNAQQCLRISKSTEEITLPNLIKLNYIVLDEKELRNINMLAAESSVLEIFGSSQEIIDKTRADFQVKKDMG